MVVTTMTPEKKLFSEKLYQLYLDGSDDTKTVINACCIIASFINKYKLNGYREKELMKFGIKFMISDVIDGNMLGFCNFPLFVYEKVINKCNYISEYAYEMAILVFKKACCIFYGIEHVPGRKKQRGKKLAIYRALYSKYTNVDIVFSNLKLVDIYGEFQKLFGEGTEGAKYNEKTHGIKISDERTFNDPTIEDDSHNNSTIEYENINSPTIEDENIDCPMMDDHSINDYMNIDGNISCSENHNDNNNLISESDTDSGTSEYFVDEIVDKKIFDCNGNLLSNFYDISQFENDFIIEEGESPSKQQINILDETCDIFTNDESNFATDDGMDCSNYSRNILSVNSDLEMINDCKITELGSNYSYQSSLSSKSDMSLCSIAPYTDWNVNNNGVGGDYKCAMEENMDDIGEAKDDIFLNLSDGKFSDCTFSENPPKRNFNIDENQTIQFFMNSFPRKRANNSCTEYTKHQNTTKFSCHKCGIMHSLNDTCLIDE